MTQRDDEALSKPLPVPASDTSTDTGTPDDPEKEIGGPKEVAPTRYGDWTVKGRCIDF